jgi:hypothetical protein
MPTLIVEKHTPEGREELLVATYAAMIGWDVRWAFLKHMRRGREDVASAGLVAGHVPFVLSALRQAGAETPVDDCYPEALAKHLHRGVRRTTLRRVIGHVEATGLPVFVKPAARTKRFTGFVLETAMEPRLSGIPGGEDVWACDPVEWWSEWRVYVINDRVRHVSFCDGDRSAGADVSVIESAVSDLSMTDTRPAGYAIDFGVLADGRTALIEMNDGYSIGAYEDVPPDVYFDLLRARWRQLLQHGREYRLGSTNELRSET